MTSEDFIAIKNSVQDLRNRFVESSHGRIPKSIEYLESAIASASSRDDKAALYALILGECSRCTNDELSVHFLRQQVRDLRDDPFPLTCLSTGLARSQRTQSEALMLAAQAVALAKMQDRQVKYSLTCQARVALEAGNYQVFNEALRGLIEDVVNSRAEDHGLEFDFLDHVDLGKVDKQLISQYRALAS